jgi:hypothetical protein
MVDADRVAITQGARPALYFAMRAANRPGRPVGYFAPAYTAFKPLIIDADMRAVPIQIPNQRLSFGVLKLLLLPITDGVFIFNNPHNPTGRVFTASEVGEFCDAARALNIRLISDFVYADLYEADAPVSILSMEPAAIEIISISKPFRACGWRVGAVVGDRVWAQQILERYTAMNGVPFTYQFVAAVAWFEMPGVETYRGELKRRRNALVKGLRDLDFSVETEIQNRSGMFVWAKIPDRFTTAAEVKRQLAAFAVLVADGADFGGESDRYIRFALNEPVDVLLEAVFEIRNAMETTDDHNEGALPARCADGRAA